VIDSTIIESAPGDADISDNDGIVAPACRHVFGAATGAMRATEHDEKARPTVAKVKARKAEIRRRYARHRTIGSRGRHPSTIRPYDATKTVIQDYLKAFHRPRKAKALRRKRVKAALRKAETAEYVRDLDCRTSALDAVITDNWKTIAQLMKELARCPAFRTAKRRLLKGHSLRVAIIRTLNTPALKARIEISERVEKHGNRMLIVRRPT
jgi:hypothetical protein